MAAKKKTAPKPAAFELSKLAKITAVPNTLRAFSENAAVKAAQIAISHASVASAAIRSQVSVGHLTGAADAVQAGIEAARRAGGAIGLEDLEDDAEGVPIVGVGFAELDARLARMESTLSELVAGHNSLIDALHALAKRDGVTSVTAGKKRKRPDSN